SGPVYEADRGQLWDSPVLPLEVEVVPLPDGVIPPEGHQVALPDGLPGVPPEGDSVALPDGDPGALPVAESVELGPWIFCIWVMMSTSRCHCCFAYCTNSGLPMIRAMS